MVLDQIFNGGTDTTDTPSTNTVTLSNGLTIHLPTQAELVALYNAKGTPTGWSGLSYGVYWTATQAASGVHNYMVLYTGLVSMLNDTSPFCVPLEVVTATTPDTTAPTVSSTSPANSATGVAVNTAITATFSETMTASTISTATFTLNNGVTGTVTYSGTTATFTPSSNLAYSTTYTATITAGAKDAAGNALASNYAWTFTTGSAADTTPPTVSSTSPVNSATAVAVNPTITATFSEAMQSSTITTTTFTLKAGTTNITGTATYSGTTATFTPSSNLAYSTTYTATITAGVKDSAGNAMAAAYTWTFTTGAVGANFKMSDTNQTTSYTSTFGEDHDYTINPPSYTDNGNGTVKDNVSGLIWQKQDDATARTWNNAATYCNNLNLAGQTGWRLPSRIELVSILDYGVYNPSINSTYFPGTFSSGYWSSTTYPSSFSSYAWYVNFGNGRTLSFTYDKTYSYYVRCVRGGQ